MRSVQKLEVCDITQRIQKAGGALANVDMQKQTENYQQQRAPASHAACCCARLSAVGRPVYQAAVCEHQAAAVQVLCRVAAAAGVHAVSGAPPSVCLGPAAVPAPQQLGLGLRYFGAHVEKLQSL